MISDTEEFLPSLMRINSITMRDNLTNYVSYPLSQSSIQVAIQYPFSPWISLAMTRAVGDSRRPNPRKPCHFGSPLWRESRKCDLSWANTLFNRSGFIHHLLFDEKIGKFVNKEQSFLISHSLNMV